MKRRHDTDTNVVVSAFTEEQVEHLTGISRSQLRYWDRTGFFHPSLAHENRRHAYSRIYSFRDVACLQVLNALRNESKVSLPHLREVKDRLAHLGDDVWAKTTLYVLQKKVVFHNPETSQREEVVTGQGVLSIPLEIVRNNLAAAAKALRERDTATIGRVEQKRGLAHNRPVISGTRIPIASIKAFKKAGYTIEEIQKEYPNLSEQDIRTALEYGGRAA